MSTLRIRLGNAARLAHEFFEDRWFDFTRDVRTSGDVALRAAGISEEETQDSELYVPARPRHIRQALREMPVQDPSGYTYIDLGSGKGRTLLIAAELPFQQIIGVEFSELLHRQAVANIRRFRLWKQRCHQITSLHQNAKTFVFPDEKIVLYLFNPFGSETMGCVLQHLQRSLERQPRHVVVVLLWPRCGDQVLQIPGMHLRSSTERHQIFETS